MRGIKLLSLLLLLCVFSTLLQAFKLGVENIPTDAMQWMQQHPVGLVTNQTGRDQSGNRTVDILLRNKARIATIFVPEHGLDGTVLAEKEVANGLDKNTSIPITSLYAFGSGKKLTASMVNNIDAFVFDIQDCGMRYFTYISTLFHVLDAAATFNKRVIVLDRPNPLGVCMEGPLVESRMQSFRAIAPIPMRHGLTVGELAYYFNRHALKKPAKVYVVTMSGYSRNSKVSDSLVAKLSPNIASRNACYGYSFLGLLGEVRPFKLGIGSNNAAFCSILLPSNQNLSQKSWNELRTMLASMAIRTAPYEYLHPKEKKVHRGIRIHIDDINTVSSMKTLFAILDFFKSKDVKLTFSTAFDRSAGTSKVREFVEGYRAKQPFFQGLNKEVHGFYAKAKPLFLYKPLPVVVEL